MKGVTILNEIEIYGIDFIWLLIPAIVVLVGAGLFIVDDLFYIKKVYIIASIIIAVGFIGLMFSATAALLVPTGKYKYEVTIDDNVSMKEFNEHHEILEQRGEIYVVKEK